MRLLIREAPERAELVPAPDLGREVQEPANRPFLGKDTGSEQSQGFQMQLELVKPID